MAIDISKEIKQITIKDGFPAINVKVNSRQFGPKIEKIMERFNLPENVAERALQEAFDETCYRFWAEDIDYNTGPFRYADTGPYGRSNGWFVARGMGPVSEWDSLMLAKWQALEILVEAKIKYLCDADTVLEILEDLGYQYLENHS